MDKLLSIIVLAYKSDDFLFETVESILEQDYPTIEIVVCDDATPGFDKTGLESFIADNKRNNLVSATIVSNDRNLGTVRNLNNGIRLAKGNYIKIIAGDDQLAKPDVCSRQIIYLEKHADVVAVAGNIEECDAEMTPVSKSGFLLNDDTAPLFHNKNELLRYICRDNTKALATQVLCFRKEFFVRHGLYDESYLLIEDLPMAVRIVESGEKIGYINYLCAKHRGETGVSTSRRAFDPHRIRYYEDLERYYVSLFPLSNILGRNFVHMRHRVCQFRIEYCNLHSAPFYKKAVKVLEYSIPLAYYFTTNLRRAFAYLSTN